MNKQLDLLDIKSAIMGDTRRIRKATVEIFILAKTKSLDQDRYKREVARALFLREIDKKPATNSKEIVLNMDISESMAKELAAIIEQIENTEDKSALERKQLMQQVKTIGNLRLIRDLSESRYQAAIKSLDGLKSNLSALQSILRHQEEI